MEWAVSQEHRSVDAVGGHSVARGSLVGVVGWLVGWS